MYVLLTESDNQKEEDECHQIDVTNKAELWHNRYGHLSFKGLQTLKQKEMVIGLPEIKQAKLTCDSCMKGKQHRAPFPKQKHGIKRQLTTAYTPQQNGISERKNRTIMNMVRAILIEKGVPKMFWAEAVQWANHVLNRCPALVVLNTTPEEAWSGVKPSVEHFKIFGCIGHVHIPDVKRTKLDHKSVKCVFLGFSSESKAFRMFEPLGKKVHISRDVIFEEDKMWDWNSDYSTEMQDDLEWKEGDNNNTDDSRDNNNTDDSRLAEEVTETETYEIRAQTPSQNHDVSQAREVTSREGRNRQPPVWANDYVLGDGLYDAKEVGFANFTISEDPIDFEEAVKHLKWRESMDAEI
ncbi:hypothetical protein V2J09_003842 [Rumex salicifolius]